MKKFIFKMLWILYSICFIGLGIFCILNPEITMTSLGILLGVMLIISGIFDLIVYFKIHGEVIDGGWILVEGIFTLLSAILLLSNQYLTNLLIPTLFAIWILLTGVCRVVNAFDFKHFGLSHWWILMVIGLLLMAIGMFSIFKPIIASMTVSVILGILLISNGVEMLVKAYYLNQFFQRIKQHLKI